MKDNKKSQQPEKFSKNLVLNDLKQLLETRFKYYSDKQYGKGEIKALIKKYETHQDRQSSNSHRHAPMRVWVRRCCIGA